MQALESGIEPDLIRARIEELKAEKATAQMSLPKLGLAPERQDPAAVLDQLSDLSERLRDADEATLRTLFDAFDLSVVYDKASDRLSISATLTETVATTLRTNDRPARLGCMAFALLDQRLALVRLLVKDHGFPPLLLDQACDLFADHLVMAINDESTCGHRLPLRFWSRRRDRRLVCKSQPFS